MQIRRALAACAVVLLLICGCRGGSANVKTTTSTVSIGQQLIDLKKAYDSGAMSQDQYNKAKSKLIKSVLSN